MTVVRVQFGVQEDARRVALDLLAGCGDLDSRQQARLAAELVARLRDAGLLQQSVEQHYSALEAGRLVGRGKKYMQAEARAGRIPGAKIDDGGWLLPASGLQRWLDAKLFSAAKSSEVQAA